MVFRHVVLCYSGDRFIARSTSIQAKAFCNYSCCCVSLHCAKAQVTLPYQHPIVEIDTYLTTVLLVPIITYHYEADAPIAAVNMVLQGLNSAV